MSEPTPAKCHCGSRSWGKEPETSRYTCVSCYRPLWMPIKTAPRDEWILLLADSEDGSPEVVVGKWLMKSKSTVHFMWARVDGTWMTVTSDQLTHWMPMPDLPKLD